MTDTRPPLWFYHLTRSRIEVALPKLLEKAYSQKQHALVRTRSEELMETLNQELWTYDEHSFLPHGSMRESDSDRQPIYLTTAEENPAGATLLVLAEDAALPADVSPFSRIFYFFDGADDAAVATARSRWKEFKDAGYPLAYWQQNMSGGWEKKEV